MDQAEIDKINKTIPFVDGKIYWKDNNWTSKLWEEMYEAGWRAVQSEENPEYVVVQDELGSSIYSAKGRINMLKQLVKIFLFR